MAGVVRVVETVAVVAVAATVVAAVAAVEVEAPAGLNAHASTPREKKPMTSLIKGLVATYTQSG